MQLSDDHISRLIMEKILGMISLEDDAILQQLQEDEPAVYLQYQGTLLQMKQMQENGIVPQDVDAGWQQIDSLITRRKNIKLRKTIASIAAVMVFLFIAGGAVFLWKNAHHTKNAQVAAVQGGLRLKLSNGKTVLLSGAQNNISVGGVMLNNDSSGRTLHYQPAAGEDNAGINTLLVPPGMDYKIQLSDGTEITLNSATQLSFPFTFKGNTREISINGEAYLKVAHNAAKSFIVHLPNSTVRVLGTQFNINTYNENIAKVSLVQGSLRFSSSKDSLLLVPGKEGVLEQQSMKEEDINEDDLAWINGEYIMNNTSVHNIASLIPRWFGVQVVLDNPNIAGKKFSGIIYKNKTLNDFLEMLKGTTDADYYYVGNVLHLK